ncbi:MAG: hypothetical protein LBJ16_01045 [Holosporaceae bacterium]|jgi:hypothetical protein|nr:hypothetical protein [Holosporaceae bacterium]
MKKASKLVGGTALLLSLMGIADSARGMMLETVGTTEKYQEKEKYGKPDRDSGFFARVYKALEMTYGPSIRAGDDTVIPKVFQKSEMIRDVLSEEAKKALEEGDVELFIKKLEERKNREKKALIAGDAYSLLSMNRDINLKLVVWIECRKDIRELFAVAGEWVNWKKHVYFRIHMKYCDMRELLEKPLEKNYFEKIIRRITQEHAAAQEEAAKESDERLRRDDSLPWEVKLVTNKERNLLSIWDMTVWVALLKETLGKLINSKTLAKPIIEALGSKVADGSGTITGMVVAGHWYNLSRLRAFVDKMIRIIWHQKCEGRCTGKLIEGIWGLMSEIWPKNQKLSNHVYDQILFADKEHRILRLIGLSYMTGVDMKDKNIPTKYDPSNFFYLLREVGDYLKEAEMEGKKTEDRKKLAIFYLDMLKGIVTWCTEGEEGREEEVFSELTVVEPDWEWRLKYLINAAEEIEKAGGILPPYMAEHVLKQKETHNAWLIKKERKKGRKSIVNQRNISSLCHSRKEKRADSAGRPAGGGAADAEEPV